MITTNKKGFTLIEILIVVAIIAILASIVLVGLGPTQALGRDSRRVSDLAEVQNGLELYYAPNGKYPAVPATWAAFATSLESAGLGINNVPSDPSSNRSYNYGASASQSQYILEAVMESNQDGFWTSYAIPSNLGSISATTAATKPTCDGISATPPTLQYCVTL